LVIPSGLAHKFTHRDRASRSFHYLCCTLDWHIRRSPSRRFLTRTGEFECIFVLPYISIIISLAGSKSMTAKECGIKYKINTTLCGTSTAVDPAKRDDERTRIEHRTLGFRPGTKRALPATGRIDGIDRAFLFGNARLPAPTRVALRPAIAGRTGGRGLSPCRYALY
jgi:hypothetical protein